VMLSPREMNIDQLPDTAQTWVNQHLKFTHGAGLAMSPVNKKDTEGLPVFYVKDIPAVSDVGLKVDQPALYSARRATITQSSIRRRPSSTIPRARTTSFRITRIGRRAGVGIFSPSAVQHLLSRHQLARHREYRDKSKIMIGATSRAASRTSRRS